MAFTGVSSGSALLFRFNGFDEGRFCASVWIGFGQRLKEMQAWVGVEAGEGSRRWRRVGSLFNSEEVIAGLMTMGRRWAGCGVEGDG